MKKTVLKLSELSCGHCVASTKKALEAVPGVVSADVTIDKAVVLGDVDAHALIKAVEDAGYKAQLENDDHTIVLHLSDLSCDHCVGTTKKALEAVPGVSDVQVSLDKAIVKGDASPEALIAAVEKAGYKATLADAK